VRQGADQPRPRLRGRDRRRDLAPTWAFRATGLAPADLTASMHPDTLFISRPDSFAVIIAAAAGVAGMLSLTTASSGTLIGVLISVTTIPAAANAGVAVAYGAGRRGRGAPRCSSRSTSRSW
jgi:hypothetical protein